MLDIAIFTREKNDKLQKLIEDLENQSFQDFSIKIYSDKKFDCKHKVVFTENKNISEKRNQAIKESNQEFLFLLDDDNRIFNKNFLQNLFSLYKEIEKEKWACIISPTIFWRETNIIQSAGIEFNFLLWKVFSNKQIKWKYWQSKWIGGNSLFGKKEYFEKAKFDENIWFIREDIDFSYSLWENNIKIFVVNEKINHMERDKTELEKSFIKWEAFKRKLKNRNIFVKKHWNIKEKLSYWLIWYWLWLIYWTIKRTFKS